MKALFIKQHGDLNRIEFGDVPVPEAGPGEVLVKTAAAALNHLDLFVVEGLPGVELTMPHVPGSDGAGVVESTGEGVSSFRPGDHVMLNPCLWCGRCEFCIRGEHSLCVRLRLVGEHRAGTFGEYFAVPETSLAGIPDGVSFREAAAFPLVHQTAWRMLRTRARLRPGQDIFIHGIGGGVNTAALRIGKLSGCRVFVSSSSDEKLDRARELGADCCYNYLRQNVVSEVLRDTAKRGVDVVVDNVGDATWMQSLKIVCKGGKIVTVGATTGPNPATEIRLIFWKQIDILGSTMSNRTEFLEVVGLLARGALRPCIDRVFPLSEGKRALEFLAAGKQFGKIVLEPGARRSLK